MNNVSSVYTSKPLTQLSLKYTNPEAGFIHSQISPVVKVLKESGKIWTYGTEGLRLVNTIRSVGGKPNVIETTFSSADHYQLEDHVLGEYIPEEEEENADSPISSKVDSTSNLTDVLMIGKEKALADTFQSTSLITQNTTLTGTDQWNDYDNSNPLEDITTGINAVRAGSGKMPNSMIIAWDTLLKLQLHPNIIDMYPTNSVITSDMVISGLIRVFPYLKNLYVGMVQYNNSNLGAALNLTEIWTKSCIIAYIEPRPTLKSRSLSFTYQQKASRRVEVMDKGRSLELMQRKSSYVQVSDKYDQVLVDDTCAYLVDGAIA